MLAIYNMPTSHIADVEVGFYLQWYSAMLILQINFCAALNQQPNHVFIGAKASIVKRS